MANFDVTVTANADITSVNWNGGPGTFHCHGTFGGGTAKLLYSIDNGVSFYELGSSTNFTSSGGAQYFLPACKIKATLTGSTSPNLRMVTLGNG